MSGLGWILLGNQVAGLPGFGEPTQPITYDNQYGSCFKVTSIKTNAILKQNMEF